MRKRGSDIALPVASGATTAITANTNIPSRTP